MQGRTGEKRRLVTTVIKLEFPGYTEISLVRLAFPQKWSNSTAPTRMRYDVNRLRTALLLTVLGSSTPFAASADSSESVAAQLRDKAISGQNIAYSWVDELTTRFGARPAGSDTEHRAAAWAAEKFKQLGFENVQIETFPLTAWVRGQESGQIVSPSPQALVVSALGASSATPPEGVEGELVIFPTLEDLLAAPKGSLNGRIAMVDRHLVPTQDTAGYAAAAGARTKGPQEAAQRGAIAFLVRSLSTNNHRLAHTGTTLYLNGRTAIPSFAVSVPDSDQLVRLSRSGQAIRLRLLSTSATIPDAHSQNVIAEIPGSDRPQEIVMLGCHLDSWDLGTGALDDGAGCGIVIAAAHLIADLPHRPRRTIRVVLFGSEEIAQPAEPFVLPGGNAYAREHAAELAKHVLIGESDAGPARVYAVHLPTAVQPKSEFYKEVFRVLTPIDVLATDQVSETGIDIVPAAEKGVPVFAPYPDMTHYFDVHHSSDDTLEQIDRPQMNQSLAAWTVVTYLAADSDMQFRGPPVSTPTGTRKSLLESLAQKK